jgi:transposase
MRDEFGDIMRVLLATAPHDKPVAASLTDGTARYRRALVAIARRLADLHALRDGMDVEQAVDVLWFYFGYSSLFTLRERERLELRTRGTMARRTSDLGSTSKSPAC